jgi:hypothetical protein
MCPAIYQEKAQKHLYTMKAIISKMEAIWIIIVLIFLIIGFFAFKKMMKIVFSLLTILGFFILFCVGYLYLDVMDLQNNWSAADKLLMVKENSEVLAVYVLGEKGEEIEDVDSYKIYLKNSDFTPLTEEYYKVLIIDIKSLKTKSNIIIKDKSYSSEEALDMIRKKDSNSPVIAEAILESRMKNEPLYIFSEYDKGNIEILPETLALKMIKIIPFSLISSVVPV